VGLSAEIMVRVLLAHLIQRASHVNLLLKRVIGVAYFVLTLLMEVALLVIPMQTKRHVLHLSAAGVVLAAGTHQRVPPHVLILPKKNPVLFHR
jgi:hypothetical protein